MAQPESLLTPSTSIATRPQRVTSIDILRALTMVLMVFVNDLWSLNHIPLWLEHVPANVDGIGLADTVFPAFLFIVGLSLPHAIKARYKKGTTYARLVGHVVSRSIALLVMGVFLVNGESINEMATGMTRGGWNSLACFSFILIWNTYPKTVATWAVTAAKTVGILVLLGMAYQYRGGNDPLSRFEPHWWGILGLIGWSYLAAALVTVFAHQRLSLLVLAWLGFVGLSIADHAGLLPAAIKVIPAAISGGTFVGLTMGGVVISTLFERYRQAGTNQLMTFVFVLLSVGLVGLSLYTWPLWGLSKLGATPAWLFLCSAFTLLAFTALYWLTDVGGKANWFALIKPAGTDTLLCYLLPYFAYAFMSFMAFALPDAVLTGGVGLLKSLLFAVGCAWLTGVLNRWGVQLHL